MNPSEVIECRGERFIKTTWNGISVLKHEATGYYNMSSACHEYTKRINDWRRNKKTIELLEIASEVLHLPIEVSDAGFPASALIFRFELSGNELARYADLQGYYIHPDLFHSFAEWISPEYGFKVSELMAKIASEKAVDRTVESIKPKEIEVDENEVIVIRDKRFRLYNYFGYQVYQDIETGWLNAGQFVKAVAEIEGKDVKLKDFKATDDWKLALEFGRRTILEQYRKSDTAASSENSNENLETSQGGISPLASNSEIETQILSIYGNEYTKAKGSYVPYRVFQLVALWADKRHKLEVLEFLQALNENANAKQENAYKVLAEEKSKLEVEISDLKAKNESKNHSLNELEAELVSRAIKIEELTSEIEDLTTPIDTRLAPPTIYAKYIDDAYFQLKQSASILGPNVRTLRRESFNGAIECLKQAKRNLKKRNILVNVNGNLLIEQTHLDEVFDLIHEIKDRKNENKLDKNEWLDARLASLRNRRQTPQVEGKIFELEYIRQHEELIPWDLLDNKLRNKLNEMSKDSGIDAVRLENNEVIEIIQMKYKRIPNSGKLETIRSKELVTFMSKSEQPRYKGLRKRLILKGCTAGPHIRKQLESQGIEIELL